ncbi:hypothetical protein N7494_007598 [Penicillium frequentans]|uniref:Zn(2)-C6 fungal-type domain-containing protein n=1 Tax=Penicillium frequentans TaxID=3151616 RepID=A0AAD6CVD5_9EURO|nr:hypothetical protein N7494_007598 [Penicillium glabrum]
MPPDRTSATQRYGRACANCSQSKCKCITRPGGQGCERCYRLKKPCLPGDSNRALNAQKNNPNARIARLEGKLDGLVSLLGGGQVPLNNVHPSGADHLTPPASTSIAISPLSTTSGASSGATSSFTFDLSPEACLMKFRTHMLKYFAFMHISDDVEYLRRERPFLFLCIMAAAAPSTQAKIELGERIKETLTDRIFLDNDSNAVNIDLLLGLLTFLAWGHDHLLHGTAARLSRFTQLAMSLVFDLRLNKPLPDDPNMLPVGGNCLVSGGSARPLEERRAVLGCFVMSSIVSSYFAQIDEMQWTPYMTECLDVLSLSPESPYDEMFTHQVRLQRVAGEVESAKLTMASPPPFYLSVLQMKVNDIKTKISPCLQQEVPLLASVYYTELSMFGLALSKHNTSGIGFHRTDRLYECLNTVKLAFENFFQIPLVEYSGISFPFFTQLARYLIVLSRLSTLNDPNWDASLARSTVDVLHVIDQLLSNIQQAKSADGEECTGGPLDKSTGIFTSVRAWCAGKLAEDGVAGVQGASTSFEPDMNSDTQVEALFLEDAWWRGSFDVFLQGNDLL